MRDSITALREQMRKQGIDMWIALTSDAHGSEYISAHDNTVRFLSGFSGENGRLAVTADEAHLWTDGRFFISAAAELNGSGIELMKDGEPGVPVLTEWVESYISKHAEGDGSFTVGFDGRTFSAGAGLSLIDRCRGARVVTDADLVGQVWKDRPAQPENDIWDLPSEYAGESSEEKLARVREAMKAAGIDAILDTRLDNIGWLLNKRGSDIPHNPVFYGYLYIDAGECLFSKDRDELIRHMNSCERLRVSCDKSAMDYDTYLKLKEVHELKDTHDIIAGIKAVKSPEEIRHIRESHVRDGAYLTSFIFRIKKLVREGRVINEVEAADMLDEIRRSDEKFVTTSFPTISAYGPNAAIVHYNPHSGTPAVLKPEGLYLVDSGGTYLDGTTDVTRTIALGPLSDDEKKHYTLVMVGMLRLMAARFPGYTTMPHLDAIAREPLWEAGCDYNHGTGHGVGYVNCCHEGPVTIRRSVNAGMSEIQIRPVPGILTSDEPGVYIEGRYGIRIEDLLVCEKDEVGGWLRWENMTWVPLEPEAVDERYMSPRDISLYRDYQKKVYEMIGPELCDEERAWLRKICEM